MTWQVRSLFVSSTFRDMHSERDYLSRHVFPLIAERLRERRHHFEPVDLRWGVEAAQSTDAEARELLILKVCLDQLRQAHPFVLVLLGDRYGWVPPADRAKQAVQDIGARVDRDIYGKSVTALEIEHGVLGCWDRARRTHFYLRDPLPYHRMNAKTSAEFSEAHATDGNGSARQAALHALKARIQAEVPADRVHSYRAVWDEESGRVSGLESFGEMVLEHLWADLVAEIPQAPKRAEPHWQNEEERELEDLIEYGSRGFVGRDEVANALISLAQRSDADGIWGASVTGPSGAGKTSLFAHLCRQLGGKSTVLLSHAAGMSPRSTSVDSMLERWNKQLAMEIGATISGAEGCTGESLDRVFAALLSEVSSHRRIVILLDAVDQLEPTTRGRHLTWLPNPWPRGARLITTSVPCAASTALECRSGARSFRLGPLSTAEAERIANNVCEGYHRKLHPEVMAAVLGRTREDATPASGNPLWLRLAVDELNLLDQDDFERADRSVDGPPEEKLHHLLLSTAASLPAEVADLYSWTIERAKRVCGAKWVNAFLSLLSAGRRGLRVLDLEVLIPAITAEPWNPVHFASVRRMLRGQVLQRGIAGQLDFRHTEARRAVARHGPPDSEYMKRVHLAIVHHLETLPAGDPLRADEMMHHLMNSGERALAATWLGREHPPEDDSRGAIRYLADRILAEEDGESDEALSWTTSLLDATHGDSAALRLCDLILFPLHNALLGQARASTRSVLLHATRYSLARLIEAKPGDRESVRDLSVTLFKLGDIDLSLGNSRAATAEFDQAGNLIGALLGGEPDNPMWERDKILHLSKLGEVEQTHGNLAMARQYFNQAYSIWQGMADTRNSRNDELLFSLALLRELELANGNYDVALNSHTVRRGLLDALGIGGFVRVAVLLPGIEEWLHDPGNLLEKLGRIELASNDLPAARLRFSESLHIRQVLASAFPTIGTFQRNLSCSLNDFGDVAVAEGNLSLACEFFTQAVQIRKRLMEADPADRNHQRDLAASLFMLGNALVQAGDLPRARHCLVESHHLLESLVKVDPNDINRQEDFLSISTHLGCLLLSQRDFEGARQKFTESHNILQRLVAASQPRANAHLEFMAKMLAKVAQAEEDWRAKVGETRN